MQPGTVEAVCLGCQETFVPDLREDEVNRVYLTDRDPIDWGLLRYTHTAKESGEECGHFGRLTPQGLSRLRHPINRGKL